MERPPGSNATLASISSSPSGGTAYRLTSTTSSTYSRIFANPYSGSGDTITASVYLRADVPFVASLRVRCDGVPFVENVNVTTDWQRFQLSVVSIFTSSSDFSIHLNADGISGTSVTGRTLDVWGAQLQKNSTATDYIPTTSTISGAPRFDHDPVTGESLGLLIEESRTNLVTYSIPPTISGNGWTVNSATGTANAAVAPDGTTTATQFEITNSDPDASRVFTFPFNAGTPIIDRTVSVFVKSGTANELYMRGVNNDSAAIINLATGQVTSNTSTSTITTVSYPNNWWRIVLTANSGFSIIYTTLPVGTSGTYYLWGAQVEANASFPTSYIPTSGTTVTRAADVASITGTNFSSWYNQSEGTVFVKGSTSDLDGNTGWSSFFQASSPNNNRISIRVVPTLITSTGTTVAQSNSASPTVNETEEIAFAYKENDFAQ